MPNLMQRFLRTYIFSALAFATLAIAAPPDKPPRVHILGTGGTISGVADERIMLSGYRAGTYTIDKMLADIPEAAAVANVTYEQVINVGSGQITDTELLTLTKRINTLISEQAEIDGFVVTHGTGTLEETAYFLHLACRTDKPIVVVGAMRPWSALSTDGHLNLYNAIRVAAAPSSRGQGALIVLNDEINSAREGTKTDTYRVETFNSREYGFLGYADPDKVVFYRETLKRHTFKSEFVVEELEMLPRVELVAGGYQMADAAALEAVIASKPDGIVLASSAGSFSDLIVKAREAGIIVVRSDRKGQGRVLTSDRAANDGIVTGESLRPQKARMLLKVALTKTKDPAELQRIFNQY